MVVVGRMKRMQVPRTARWMAAMLVTCLSVLAAGCTSTGAAVPPTSATDAAVTAAPTARAAALKDRLALVLGRRLDRKEAAAAMGTFQIADYDIQDASTFWGHRSLASTGSINYSEYYLTYRNTFIIMLLRDVDPVNYTCVDMRVIGKTRGDYEMSTGRVRVDGGPIDEEIIVLFNKNWRGDSSTDILAAFKANPETVSIEEVKYKTIRIYREE
jgi:hypothetical protein